MSRRLINQIGGFDWYLIINILLLMFFGLAVLYSLQMNVVSPEYTNFYRQVILAIVGLALFFGVSLINYHVWGDYYKFLLIIIIILLLGVFVAGVTIRGTRSWLSFFGQTIQPVEFAKIIMVLFLSKYFLLKAKGPELFKNVVVSGLISAGLVVLVVLQPDLGSAMILFLTWLVFILLLPIPKKKLMVIFFAIIFMIIISWFSVLKSYQKERVMVFLNPQADPLGTGYNVTQSVLAVGSGELFGRGLSLGSQSQLNFLPEQETDFIFAVIAEELGLVGSGILLALFLSLFLRIYRIAKRYSDDFGSLICYGIMTYLVIQTFINIGMNIGIAPVTGIPLPFVSYGGSSLVSSFIALGIIHSVYLQNNK